MSKSVPPYVAFGQLLSDHLAQRGLLATDLADALGVHRASVGRWLSGKSRPDPTLAVRLANALQLTDRPREQFLLTWFGEIVQLSERVR